jgi:cytochrome c oxidase subunit II
MPSLIQSALHPGGPEAASITQLWWLMFWTCTVVYVLVMGAVIVAVRRSRRPGAASPPERSLITSVVGASAVTLLILFGLLFASVVTGRAVGRRTDGDVVLRITGNQWWWDVEYVNADPMLQVRTANELHLPLGRRIRLQFASNDVIHSFWVPNLQGKMDLIPGRQTELWLAVETAGVYRGQCAEFCGLQHAHMALSVVAEPADAFERWLSAQRQIAAPPTTAEQQRGREVVERGPCALCHTVRGTDAGGRTAPDLTHVGSRSTLAAGTVPNTPGYLGGWIADPQHVKPGTRMPATGLSAEELQAVLAYLGTLK